MDEIKLQFREYFNSKRSPKILLAILCASALILIAAWGVMGMDLSRGEALPFDPVNVTQEGKYVSLEVIGIDDWSAERGNEYYYVAQGSDTLLYLVRISQSDFNAMQTQYNYWVSTISDVPAAEPASPVPLVISGYSTALPDDILAAVAQTYSYSEEEMAGYLGDYYLDAVGGTYSQNRQALLFFAVVCAFIALVIAFSVWKKNKNIEKSLTSLEQSGQLLSAWNELSACRYNDSGEGIDLTEHYIFAKGNGEIISYSDIVWAYEHLIRRRFTVVNRYVLLCLKDNTKRAVMPLKNRQTVNERILAAIAEKNPAAMLGYSKENKQKYKEMSKGSGSQTLS